MKKFAFLLFVLSVFSFAQDEFDDRMMQNKRVEQLINSRIIQVLNLDEQTSLRFFARRNDHRNQMRELSNRRDSILTELRKQLKGEKGGYFSIIQASLNVEAEILDEKNSFLLNLREILSEEQIATYVIFERRLRKEVRDLIMDKRREQKPPKNRRDRLFE